MNDENNPNVVPAPVGQPNQPQVAGFVSPAPPVYSQVSATPTATPVPTQSMQYAAVQATPTTVKQTTIKTYSIVAAVTVIALVIIGVAFVVLRQNSGTNNARENTPAVSGTSNNASPAMVAQQYMQAIYEGDCEKAWSAWDASSPYASTKSNHDTDCTSSDVVDIATYVRDHPSDYVTSDLGNGMTDVAYAITSGSEEPFTLTVTVKNGKIYQLEM